MWEVVSDCFCIVVFFPPPPSLAYQTVFAYWLHSLTTLNCSYLEFSSFCSSCTLLCPTGMGISRSFAGVCCWLGSTHHGVEYCCLERHWRQAAKELGGEAAMGSGKRPGALQLQAYRQGGFWEQSVKRTRLARKWSSNHRQKVLVIWQEQSCRLCNNGRGACLTGWQEQQDKQGKRWEGTRKKSKWTADAASGPRGESRQHLGLQAEDEQTQQIKAWEHRVWMRCKTVAGGWKQQERANTLLNRKQTWSNTKTEHGQQVRYWNDVMSPGRSRVGKWWCTARKVWEHNPETWLWKATGWTCLQAQESSSGKNKLAGKIGTESL